MQNIVRERQGRFDHPKIFRQPGVSTPGYSLSSLKGLKVLYLKDLLGRMYSLGGSEFHTKNARSRQLQEQRRAKAGFSCSCNYRDHTFLLKIIYFDIPCE